MNNLISENLAGALYEQLSHETFNSRLYLYIGGFLKNKGLENLSKHFMNQYDEEIGHMKEFFNLLTDLNTDVIIQDETGFSMPFNKISDIGLIYLAREIVTTESIDAIKKLAIEESNSIVEEMCRKMISKQQAELSEATTFMDKCTLIGDEWKFVMLWDASIG
jgi:ferritin